VNHNWNPISGKAHIQLNPICASGERALKGRQRILRRVRRRAAMTDYQRVVSLEFDG